MTPKQAKELADELTRGGTVAKVKTFVTNGQERHVVNVTHSETMEKRPTAYTIS